MISHSEDVIEDEAVIEKLIDTILQIVQGQLHGATVAPHERHWALRILTNHKQHASVIAPTLTAIFKSDKSQFRFSDNVKTFNRADVASALQSFDSAANDEVIPILEDDLRLMKGISSADAGYNRLEELIVRLKQQSTEATPSNDPD